MPAGRPKEYKAEELWFMFSEYLEHNKSLTFYRPELIRGGDMAGQVVDVPIYSPLSIMAFCLFANISVKTFNTYCNEEAQNDKELLQTSVRIRTHIQDEQIRGAAAGHYNGNIVARLNGLKEQQEVTTNQTKETINIVIDGLKVDLS